jgi:hypothetical protein
VERQSGFAAGQAGMPVLQVRAVEQRLEQSGVAIERRRDGDGKVGMGLRDGVDEPWKVAFQMHAEGKEIGDDQDSGNAFRQKYGDGAVQRGLAEFEKSGFDVREIAGAGKVCGDGAHGLVGRLDAGTVGEDDDAGDQCGTATIIA